MEKKNTGLVILIIILFFLIICLGGYIVYDKVFSDKIDDDITDKNDNNIDGNGNTNVTDEQDNNNVNKNNNKSSVNVSDVINDYKKILKEKKNSNYYLYDMNSDGIPELFIISGDSEATKEISVYTYTDNPNLKYADDIVNVGIFGCGHGNIYLSNDGQLVIFFAHMGYQHYTYYKLENDWLVRTYYSGDEYIEAGNEYRPPENVKEMITIPSSDLSLFDNYK
jgi:hypothetical protein